MKKISTDDLVRMVSININSIGIGMTVRELTSASYGYYVVSDLQDYFIGSRILDDRTIGDFVENEYNKH